MGDIDRIFNVQIDKQTAAVTRVGFGTPLLMSAEAEVSSLFTGLAKTYTALQELLDDGFATNGVAFLKASAAFAQNPKIGTLIVGKRRRLPLMTKDLVPIVKDLTLYRVTINGVDFDFTSDASATVSEIIGGLLSAINSGSEDVLASDIGPGTSLRIEKADSPGGSATAGIPFTVSFDRILFTAQNDTPDPGIVDDVGDIRSDPTGSDDWYAIILDSYGRAEILALAPLIETLPRSFLFATSDADVVTASSSDVASTLLAAAFDRTAGIWHENPHLGADLGWAGVVLPFDPGSVTWAFQTIATLPVSSLSQAETLELEGKRTSWYKSLQGINITFQGETYASGGFLDITRGIDFVQQRIKENLLLLLANSRKVSFTDEGIAKIENVVRGVMDLALAQQIFTPDPAPVVTVPKANDVDPNDRAQRILRNVLFNAQLAGAIHKVEVFGTVTV